MKTPLIQIPESIQHVKQKADELNKELKAVAKKSVIKDLFLSFFEVAPEVEAVRWTQYTPHFNDGDVCEFSVQTPEFMLKEPETDFEPTWDLFCAYDDKKKPTVDEKSTLGRALIEMSDIIEGRDMASILQMTFDDGYEVTVYRSGKIEVEQYDHD